MAEYYLISQLPSLDGMSDSSPVPITEERFLELCERFLKKKARSELEKLTLLPSKDSESTGSGLIDAWNENERNLRFALARARAEKMKKPFDMGDRILPADHVRVANAAMEIENPMEAEKYLNNYRLQFLETLSPADHFAEDYVFYYGIKLKLILRIRQFDTAAGEAAYRNIYSSILSGDGLEARR